MTTDARCPRCRHVFNAQATMADLDKALTGTRFEGAVAAFTTLTCPKCGGRVHYQPPPTSDVWADTDDTEPEDN